MDAGIYQQDKQFWATRIHLFNYPRFDHQSNTAGQSKNLWERYFDWPFSSHYFIPWIWYEVLVLDGYLPSSNKNTFIKLVTKIFN